jgi:hypothetical protein
MTRSNLVVNPPDGNQAAWLRPVTALAVVEVGLFAAVWMGFGVFAFVMVHRWGVEFDRKMEMIGRGEVKPETLRVVGISQDKEHGGWNVSLGKGGKAVAWRSDNKVEDLRVGSETDAYRFGDGYLVPRFDRGGHHWGKWVFLGFGLLPLPVAGGALLFKTLRRARQHPLGAVPIQKAFSRPSMLFDGAADDSQLVCLLGDSDCGPVKAVEEAGLLTASPRLVPMKFVVPWMLFTAVAITCMMCFFFDGPRVFFWLLMGMLWLLALPTLLGLLALINRHMAKKGDHFRVDMTRRTLELCRIGRTLKASEIIAITLLTRWYRGGGGQWSKTHQTGVLLRTPDGRAELCPVVRELGENTPSFRKSTWADRLAAIFQVPVRRIELNKSESRALNDC